MQKKMSFWEKFSYRIGLKNPCKVKIGKQTYSPLEEAAIFADMERLDFFGRFCKLTQPALDGAMLSAPSGKVLDKLVSIGGELSDEMKHEIITRIADQMLLGASTSDFEDNIDLFRKNKVHLTYHDKNHYSLYDAAYNKADWFKYATQEEIGHEFRQAVALDNFSKAEEMIKESDGKIDVNAKGKSGHDAMYYALHNHNAEMAFFLYENGAKLDTVDEKNKNHFEYATPEIQQGLVDRCIVANDLDGLKAADKAGVEFGKPDYLLKTSNPDILKFLAEKGCSVNDAIYTLYNSVDEFDGKSESSVKQIELLSKIREEIEPQNTVDISSKQRVINKEALMHEFRKAVARRDYEKVQDMIADNVDNPDFDINATNKKGDDALGYAFQNDDIKMAMMLYDNGALLKGDVLYKKASYKMREELTALCIKKGDVAGIEAMIECVNSKDPKNWEVQEIVMANAYKYNELKKIRNQLIQRNEQESFSEYDLSNATAKNNVTSSSDDKKKNVMPLVKKVNQERN